MTLTIIFIASGICMIILVLAKMRELEQNRRSILFGWISRGDRHVGGVHHKAIHHYSVLKEKGTFFVSKQLPMHTKNLMNKTETIVKEKSERYIGNIRNSRLLRKRKDGISEFFKNLSDKENRGSQNDRDLVE